MISTACVSERPGLFVPAIQFFLHVQLDKKRAGDDSSDDEGIAPVQQKKSAFADLPVRAHSRQAKKQLRAALRSKRKSIKINHKNNAAQFPAIQLIHDPQRLAERLFGRVKKVRTVPCSGTQQARRRDCVACIFAVARSAQILISLCLAMLLSSAHRALISSMSVCCS